VYFWMLGKNPCLAGYPDATPVDGGSGLHLRCGQTYRRRTSLPPRRARLRTVHPPRLPQPARPEFHLAFQLHSHSSVVRTYIPATSAAPYSPSVTGSSPGLSWFRPHRLSRAMFRARCPEREAGRAV